MSVYGAPAVTSRFVAVAPLALTTVSLLGLVLPLACRTSEPVAQAPAPPARTHLTSHARSVEAWVSEEDRAVTLALDGSYLRVSAPSQASFHVAVSANQDLRGLPSFAVANEQRVPLRTVVSEGLVTVSTDAARHTVARGTGELELFAAQGTLLGRGVVQIAEGQGARVRWSLGADTRVFGLGDKLKGFDRRGKTFEMWNHDAYGFGLDTDPLYKTFPFLLLLDDARAHALYVDSPARARVDVGATSPNELSYALTPEHARTLQLYLFAGPTAQSVISDYSALTGRMPLPPRWALGYHQSRYGYKTEAEVRGIVSRLRKGGFPLDAIWLDIDYQDGFAPFTVNQAAFPHFSDMVASFRKEGTRTVVITDPHIKWFPAGSAQAASYAPLASGSAGDHFVRSLSGSGALVAEVWPGDSVFPEFARASTRAWWGTLYADFVSRGVAGFWNDMNEPASFGETKTLPKQARFRLDDDTSVDHETLHNAYGALNARATYEGLRKLRPETRPFVLTRAASPGAQRYAATWTGDNTASAEHLAATIPQLLNLGVSGMPFAGADVGGFVGCPSPELLSTWMELGALQPFFRNHAAQDACAREPWVHGAAWERRMKNAVERRYRLLPYLYTVFEETARTGLPVMRPVWLERPELANAAAYEHAYFLGRDLLVVLESPSYGSELPPGVWYDLDTEKRVMGGPLAPAKALRVRLFARGGAIVPSMAPAQSTSAATQGALTLDVWQGAECAGALYTDDGESFAFERGETRRVEYACQLTAEGGVRVEARSQGSFVSLSKGTTLRIHGVAKRPKRAVARGHSEPLAFVHDARTETLTVQLDAALGDFSIDVN